MVEAAATVYVGGVVHTFDPAIGTAEAMVVRGDRVMAVGPAADCLVLAGSRATRVNIDGAAIVPGLTDAHIHTATWAASVAQVDLRAARSLDEAVALIGPVAGRGQGWLLGGRWDYHRWSRRVLPDRWVLDSVTGPRPAALVSADLHTLWVNSAALRLAGITRHTPDPAGGTVERDAAGEPTGIVREAAHSLLHGVMTSPVVSVSSFRDALVQLASRGMTMVHDIDGAEALDAFRHLRADGELPVRVHKLLRVEQLDAAIADGVRSGDGDTWLNYGAVKLFADGTLGSRTCWMSQPFTGYPDEYGQPVLVGAELRAQVERAAAAGWASAVHAIGDAANHDVIAALAAAPRRYDGRVLQHRIEHAQLLQPADVTRIASAGIVASMQPIHWAEDRELVDTLLGGRELAAYAWRSLLEAGTNVIFGSDAPVSEPDPWAGIHAAVTRDDDQRLTAAQALGCYLGPGGVLRPGAPADFAVLTADPLTVEPDALPTISSLVTVVGGRPVWIDPASGLR